MNATLVVEVLVWVVVITCLLCCLGIVAMKDFFERLHYMATVSTVAAVALLAAVVIEQGWGQAAIKMSLIVVVLFLMNAVLTHATARAARVRSRGHWQPGEGEKIAGLEQIAGVGHKGK